MTWSAFVIWVMTTIVTNAAAWILAERRARREFRLHYQAETAARRLLEHSRYRYRTFKTLKYHLGGFEDDELRRILVQCGALRFQDSENVEIWGLLSRVGDALDAEAGTAAN